MATLIGAFAGLKYVGLLGVLLGPLAIAYFFEMLKLYRHEYVNGAHPAGGATVPPTAPHAPLPAEPGVELDGPAEAPGVETDTKGPPAPR